jgi:hypothetical protein
MNGQNESTFGSEFRVVPGWAKLLALVCAVSTVFLLSWVFGRESAPPPPALQAFMQVLVATVVAGLVLLIGYVNRDAGRRGMSRAAWTLIVIFVPNALGFILYFLLRKPIQGSCPGCGAAVRPDFNFCPKCDHKLAPICASCSRPVQPGDLYCAHCGASVKGGGQPARL